MISMLKKTESSAIYNENKSTKFVKIYITPQETEAFDTLSKAVQINSDATTRIQSTITKLEANRESTLKAVDAAFNTLRDNLDQRKSVLDQQINDVAEKHKTVLNQQLEKLTKYGRSLQVVCSMCILLVSRFYSVIFRGDIHLK